MIMFIEFAFGKNARCAELQFRSERENCVDVLLRGVRLAVDDSGVEPLVVTHVPRMRNELFERVDHWIFLCVSGIVSQKDS